MKSVPDFLKEHTGCKEVLVLGMNPSTNTRPIKNGTFARLQTWMNMVGVPRWDFHNVVPDKTGEVELKDVDWIKLYKQVKGRKVVICLGTFVARAVKGLTDIQLPAVICIDHPSSRNRNFNDPAYEPQMLKRLKKELQDAGY